MRPLTRSRVLLATITLLTTGALAACGSDTDDTDTGGASPQGGGDSLSEVQEESGVPEECREAFPAAFGEADIADVELLPEGWPEPPVDATLCQTSATLDDEVEVLSYATDAAPAEVLDAYEAALGGSFETTREDKGLGEGLSGTAGAVGFEVMPSDGSFSITFGKG